MKRMLREVSLTNKKQIIRIMMIEINSKKIIWHNVKETFKNTDQMDKEIKQKYLTYLNVLIIYMRKIKTHSTILAVLIFK